MVALTLYRGRGGFGASPGRPFNCWGFGKVAQPRLGTAHSNLAESYRVLGRFKEVEPLLCGALAALGSDHSNTQTVRGNPEQILATRGRSRGV